MNCRGLPPIGGRIVGELLGTVVSVVTGAHRLLGNMICAALNVRMAPNHSTPVKPACMIPDIALLSSLCCKRRCPISCAPAVPKPKPRKLRDKGNKILPDVVAVAEFVS